MPFLPRFENTGQPISDDVCVLGYRIIVGINEQNTDSIFGYWL
ncbi:hypothetical protein PL10110_340002 [Planktothrix agardhii]|nr:hypothetical protein PL10110_340002 [Planktothrix agardhii]